ncbi:hypothetical protein DFJ73DRAFT_817082 [Zopfochytrium polystomum]|nr:hypothetical protein DFJ73DRAFT_817082 [Zopfochytrium polystomum]
MSVSFDDSPFTEDFELLDWLVSDVGSPSSASDSHGDLPLFDDLDLPVVSGQASYGMVDVPQQRWAHLATPFDENSDLTFCDLDALVSDLPCQAPHPAKSLSLEDVDFGAILHQFSIEGLPQQSSSSSLVSLQTITAASKDSHASPAFGSTLPPSPQRLPAVTWSVPSAAADDDNNNVLDHLTAWNLVLDPLSLLGGMETKEESRPAVGCCGEESLFVGECVGGDVLDIAVDEALALIDVDPTQKLLAPSIPSCGSADAINDDLGVVGEWALSNMDGALVDDTMAGSADADASVDIQLAVDRALQWVSAACSPGSTPTLSPISTPESAAAESPAPFFGLPTPTWTSLSADQSQLAKSTKSPIRASNSRATRTRTVPSRQKLAAAMMVSPATSTLSNFSVDDQALEENDRHDDNSAYDKAGLPRPDDILKLSANPRTSQYDCPFPQCGTSQARRYNLKIHYMTHLGSESQVFTCKECARGFRRRFDMRRHRLSKHGVPLEESANDEERTSEAAEPKPRSRKRTAATASSLDHGSDDEEETGTLFKRSKRLRKTVDPDWK